MDSLDSHVLSEALPKLMILISGGLIVLFVLAVIKLYEIAKHLKDIRNKLYNDEQIKDNTL